MEKLITFSIAAYNAESTLKECLDSFLVEDCLEKIEVIIVNDGSKDSTAAIAEEYTKQYPDTFILINKENGGHGSTINTAIKLAKGKYFRPIDADDWIKSDNLKSILEELEKTETDALVCDYDIFFLKTKTTEKRNYDFLTPYYNNSFSERNEWKTTFPFHSIFYKTQNLQENKICLTEKCFYEDSEYTLYPLPFCKNFYYIPQTFYVYSMGSENQSVSFENTLRHIDDQELILKNLFTFYANQVISNKKNYYKKRIFEVLNFYFKLTLNSLWYKNKELQKRKRTFTAELKTINTILLLEYINQTVLQKVLYRTGYRFDGFMIKMYKLLKHRG